MTPPRQALLITLRSAACLTIQFLPPRRRAYLFNFASGSSHSSLASARRRLSSLAWSCCSHDRSPEVGRGIVLGVSAFESLCVSTCIDMVDEASIVKQMLGIRPWGCSPLLVSARQLCLGCPPRDEVAGRTVEISLEVVAPWF